MTGEPIHPGGLFRCCISHVQTVRAADPNLPEEGQIETCPDCKCEILYRHRIWQWSAKDFFLSEEGSR